MSQFALAIGLISSLEGWVQRQFFDIHAALARIEKNQNAARRTERIDMAKLDDNISTLTTQVQNNTTVIGSATTLINGFSAQLAAAIAAAQAAGATDAQLTALTALGDNLTAADADLAAAVAANTPAS